MVDGCDSDGLAVMVRTVVMIGAGSVLLLLDTERVTSLEATTGTEVDSA